MSRRNINKSKAKGNGNKSNGRRRRRQAPRQNSDLVSVGSAYSRTMRSNSPVFTESSGAVTVMHREYVATVHGSPGWNFGVTQAYELNPGVATTFPWLSNVARNYESYKVEDFEIEYVPTCPSGTSGSVSMFIDFDAADGAPLDELNFKNNQGAITSSPWSTMYYKVPPYNRNKAFKERYCRIGPVISDIKTYDFGKLYIGTKGQNNEAWQLGDIYLTYRITFRTPQMRDDIVLSQSFSNSGPTATNPFGEGYATQGQNLAGIRNTNTDSIFEFTSPGYYSVLLTAAGVVGLAAYTVANYGSATVTAIHEVINASANTVMKWVKIFVPSSGDGFSVHNSSMPGGAHCDAIVTTISQSEYDLEG